MGRERCYHVAHSRRPYARKRVTDLLALAKAKDLALGQELEREFKTLSSRRSFGLNFERHRPESVELPGRPVRKGDKVRILPERIERQRRSSSLEGPQARSNRRKENRPRRSARYP